MLFGFDLQGAITLIAGALLALITLFTGSDGREAVRGLGSVVAEAQAKLIVDADAVLTSTIATQQFEAVARRNAEILQALRDLQLPQATYLYSLYGSRDTTCARDAQVQSRLPGLFVISQASRQFVCTMACSAFGLASVIARLERQGCFDRQYAIKPRL